MLLKYSRLFTLIVCFLLSACEWTPPLFTPSTQAVIPSRTPSILRPTSTILFVTLTSTSDLTPSLTPETVTPTLTVSPTPTSTAAPPPLLQVEILGCSTGIDIVHQMGEVTNAFAMISNFSSQELTEVCATLFAIDEDRVHPDKTICTGQLPSLHQVLIKLTVDTQFQVDTNVRVDVQTNEGLSGSLLEKSCLDIGIFQGDPNDVGLVKPIP